MARSSLIQPWKWGGGEGCEEHDDEHEGEIDTNTHQHVSGYSREPESPTQIQSTNKKRPEVEFLLENWIANQKVELKERRDQD